MSLVVLCLNQIILNISTCKTVTKLIKEVLCYDFNSSFQCNKKVSLNPHFHASTTMDRKTLFVLSCYTAGSILFALQSYSICLFNILGL